MNWRLSSVGRDRRQLVAGISVVFVAAVAVVLVVFWGGTGVPGAGSLAGTWGCDGGRTLVLTGSGHSYGVSGLGGETVILDRDGELYLETQFEQNGWTESVVVSGHIGRSLTTGGAQLEFDGGVSAVSDNTCIRR